MDSSAATAPLVVLGVAGFGLLLVALAALLLLRPGRRTSPTASRRPPDTSHPDVEDDLPAFHARPPGSSGAPARATGGAPVALAPTATASSLARLPQNASPEEPTGPPGEGVRVTRFVLSLAALALVLVAAAAAAAIAAPSARAGSAPPATGDGGRGAVVVPDLPTVPDSPAAGQPGAGKLGYLSLPLGHGGTAARLSFGGMVLEQQAVGAIMTRPAVSLTTSGNRSLLHLRLPTWNCLAPEVPDDPAAAGCLPSVTEFGDLPSPALTTSSDGKSLLVQGRVPTYTRPNGSEPVYTGRVYDVTLTVTPGRRLGPGRYVAEGHLTLGSGTARTDGNPLLNVLTRGS